MTWQQPPHYGPPPQTYVVPQTNRRSILVAYVLWFFFGLLGVHRFYAGDTTGGIVWLLTGGLCGVGALIDLFLIPGLIARANQPQQITVHPGYR